MPIANKREMSDAIHAPGNRMKALGRLESGCGVNGKRREDANSEMVDIAGMGEPVVRKRKHRATDPSDMGVLSGFGCRVRKGKSWPC